MPVRLIAYGAEIPHSYSIDSLLQYELMPDGYDLVIARMEPENNIEIAIRAKINSPDQSPLVIVGNDNKYKRTLKAKYGAVGKIRFTEAVYDKTMINNLRHFSRLYIHGHSVGGTNPSLLEAMACGCRIVAHRNLFNESVLGEDAYYYNHADELKDLFSYYDSADYIPWTQHNLGKVRDQYNWELITGAYEQLFFDAVGDQ